MNVNFTQNLQIHVSLNMVWYKCAHLRTFVYAINNTNLNFGKYTRKHVNVPVPRLLIDIPVYLGVRIMNFNILLKQYISVVWAAARGELELIKWLQRANHGHVCSKSIVYNAAVHGHLHILEWAHDNKLIKTPGLVIYCVTLSPHPNLHIIEWVDNNYKIDYSRWHSFMINAARSGHLEILQWFCKRGAPCDTDVMNIAASNGHLHVVEWLHANRTEGCTFLIVYNTACRGHLHVLKWLQIHYPHFFTDTIVQSAISDAAKRGHFEIVKWLYSYYAHLISKRSMQQVVDAAGDAGHLHIMKWLCKNSKV